MTSITINGVSKQFPGVKALDNINISIAKGEFFTLLGPSGCGKTTLLRTIAGFYEQDGGTISFNDRRIDNIPAYKRDTGMVFQNYAVFPHMTVYENIAFGLKNRKVSSSEIERRVTEALKLARLSGYEKRTPDQLSGGQQQRVALARAIVIEPQVLLLDEPLSNLDAKLRVEMREEIRDLQKELGITAVYVTHDQEEALVISDRIAVMKSGVIQQIGKPWEIYKDPDNTFVASFIGKMNSIPIENTAKGGNVVSFTMGGKGFTLPGYSSDKDKLILAIRPEDIILSQQKGLLSVDGIGLSGTVKKCSFTGAMAVFTIDCGDEISIQANKPCPSHTDILASGSPIQVAIPYEQILLFEEESGIRIRKRKEA
jgi:iron(III) transport system ATP-binding protein